MKTLIRTLRREGARPLWHNVEERDGIKARLNSLGFYVLTGKGDSLDVYAISHEKPLDIRILEKVLDKIHFSW